MALLSKSWSQNIGIVSRYFKDAQSLSIQQRQVICNGSAGNVAGELLLHASCIRDDVAALVESAQSIREEYCNKNGFKLTFRGRVV